MEVIQLERVHACHLQWLNGSSLPCFFLQPKAYAFFFLPFYKIPQKFFKLSPSNGVLIIYTQLYCDPQKPQYAYKGKILSFTLFEERLKASFLPTSLE